MIAVPLTKSQAAILIEATTREDRQLILPPTMKPVAALDQLRADELRDAWRRLFRAQPPNLSRDLLMRAIGHRLQEVAEGGVSKADARKLAALVRAFDSGAAPAQPDPVASLRPGARLVREWRGRTHVVTVTETGFDHDGAPYRSLSQIARAITGAHWSGPRFFRPLKRSAGAMTGPAVEASIPSEGDEPSVGAIVAAIEGAAAMNREARLG